MADKSIYHVEMLARAVTKIILHCSDSDAQPQTIETIRSWHVQRGFKDVGYHWVIIKSGVLQAGRPMNKMGAHCLGYNETSIGICLTGKKIFFEEQYNTLRRLLAFVHGFFPGATLHAHNEFNKNKTCPNYEVRGLREFWNALK